MVTQAIERIIANKLKDLGVKRPQVTLEHPTDIAHGDYATNVAFVYGKKLGISPLEVAREVVAAFNQEKVRGLERVEIAGFGFINFYLASEFFGDSVKTIIERGDAYGRHNDLKNKKIIIEYTDPNLFKELHIGHLVPNVIGESISRLIEYAGADIRRFCYQGDVGLHVAKAVYGMREHPFEFWRLSVVGSVAARAKFMGRVYAYGAQKYESDESAKQAIIALNKEIYLRNNRAVNRYYDAGRRWSLEYFDGIYKILGTTFDELFFESATAPVGEELVREFLAKGVFRESEGAIFFPGEEHGLHNRVFINSNGLPTYETKELGLAKEKYEAFPYDQSIVVVATEQSEYFKVLLKVIDLVFPNLAGKTVHVANGILKLPTGKMSSRTGDVVAAVTLIDRVKELVFEKIQDRGYSRDVGAKIVEAVAIGALKFSILRQAPGKDIVFDFEKSISFEGDSGPYLQYSYARAKTLLEKGKVAGIIPSTTATDTEVTTLEKLLYRFPEVVVRAGADYAPHYVVTYLLELASSFNAFYGQGKIVDPDDASAPYKLALVKAFSQVMDNGLYVLGMEAPERM